MKKSVKAFLFSALLFPGSGYFVVGQKIKAAVMSLSVVLAIVFLYQQIMAIASPIVAKIQSGAIPLDQDLIAVMIQQSLNQQDNHYMSLASYFILIVWAVSSFDCFRLGKRIDNLQ